MGRIEQNTDMANVADTAVVTGSSSGIGLALSRMLVKNGYEVFGFGRNFERAEAQEFCKEQPEADRARLGVLGHSVGAGAALLVASRQPGLRAVVSIAAFAHPARMMRRWLAAKRIPYHPFGALILAGREIQVRRDHRGACAP